MARLGRRLEVSCELVEVGGLWRDDYAQYAPGVRRYRIDGELVAREQLERALIAEGLLPPQGQDR
jgi:hypothetical protein